MEQQAYKLLRIGEYRQPGDEYWDRTKSSVNAWQPVHSHGGPIMLTDAPHRRPIRSYEDGKVTSPGAVPMGKKCGSCGYTANPSASICPNCTHSF